MIDKALGVGDIYLSLEGFLDIQTDIHYPNALRPETNPGYKTEYRPED